MPDTTAPASLTPYTIASRTQSRYSEAQTISTLNGATSFRPIPLSATGWVRKIRLAFTYAMTCASAGAVVAGDAPWNLIANVSLSDAQGSPIIQPISGFNLYLVNKYFPQGMWSPTNGDIGHLNPHVGPHYAFSATATSGTATFTLDLDLEIDDATGYGCVPNLDSNAALQLKIDASAYTVAFTGTTVSVSNLSVRVSQYYWAPVGSTVGGRANETAPMGSGAYMETRYENGAAVASSENTLTVNAKGGMTQGVIFVSRSAGVRTAFTAASNVGVVLDNTAVNEGIPLEEHNRNVRAAYGLFGADVTTSYAPLTAGIVSGLDTGVLVVPFNTTSRYRDGYLPTKAGSLMQYKMTPGASATQMEVVTRLIQASDSAAFYARF